MTTIAIKTNDEITIQVDRELILQCGTIKTLCEDLGIMDDSQPIPLPNVHSKVMEKIVEFCKYAQGQTDALLKKYQEKMMSTFENKFFLEENAFILDIMMAANYLDLPVLLEACSVAVALGMKNLRTEEIRSLWGIDNDFAPGELEALKAHESLAE